MAARFELIDGFYPVANNVSLYQPFPETTHQGVPSLIVLCSWMGAIPRHIAKYAAGYQQHFPGVPILLVQSSLGDTFASERKQRTRLSTACDMILRLKSDESRSNGPVVLHTMSNGGSIAATRMAEIFHERGNGTVFDRFVCDCAPSKPNVAKGAQAVIMSFPKNVLLRFIGSLLVKFLMHTGMFIHCVILRREDILTKMRRLLNDPKLFNPAAARLYMYTTNDALVPHEDVHKHAQTAKEMGWKRVTEVVFDQAPHCGLIMEDEERYWKSVTGLIRG